ncbi:MAG: hypothetical protein SFV24_21955 [Gemmatimonadales bacterium]|nr:hypothetical protein [Gemmatimonadales bacterium]
MRIANCQLGVASLCALLAAVGMASGVASARPLVAQETGPGLVVPVPAPARVTVAADSFSGPRGNRLGFEVFRAAGASGPAPVVVFANGSGPGLRQMRGYRDWARLVTTRGLAGVLYDGPSFDPSRSVGDNIRESVAHLDSLVTVLGRRGAALGVDPVNVVVWAGSAQTATGTPFALSGNRPVKGYVLYYGAGDVSEPRLDVPVLVVRAGLDSPGLNAALDSLSRRLTLAGSPITVVSHPAGPHGFDIYDSTAATAQVISTTLTFMAAAVAPSLQASIAGSVAEVRASAAFAAARWSEAEALYADLARQRPDSRSVAWRLGLAQLANGNPGPALASFDRARALGQGGARDIGLPATRAAMRAGNLPRAVEWVRWALEQFPRIRQEIAADRELAPLLERPEIKGG